MTGSILFFSILIIQVLAAVIPIRNWPLTDYPMFSWPIKDFTDVSRLSLETVYPDKIVSWSHNDYMSVGLNDHRLQSYVRDINNPRVIEILTEKVSLNAALQKAISLRILRKTYRIFENEVKVEQEIVREISISQLRK